MALDNKLNITDSAELARMEEKISKKKAVEREMDVQYSSPHIFQLFRQM